IQISAKDKDFFNCWFHEGRYDPRQIALLFGDVNATGVDDLIVVNAARPIICLVSFTGGLRPGLLNRISNGYGVSTRLEYDTVANLDKMAKRSQNPWHTKLAVPAQVVTHSVTVNGLQAPFTQSYEEIYHYADPIYDLRDRAFLGF